MKEELIICPVCDREIPNQAKTKHHLYPREIKQRNKIKDKLERNKTVAVHRVCHSKIHSVFSNRELFKEYHTIESIISHPDMVNFKTWIENKPLDFDTKNDFSNKRGKLR